VVNRYGQSWDIPNLSIVGSSTFPTMRGFNPTLTIQALAYMSADAIVNRYRNNPGCLPARLNRLPAVTGAEYEVARREVKALGLDPTQSDTSRHGHAESRPRG
jgi:hypothetical protein